MPEICKKRVHRNYKKNLPWDFKKVSWVALFPTTIRRKYFPRKVIKTHMKLLSLWIRGSWWHEISSEIIYTEPVAFPIYTTVMLYVSYIWNIKLTSPEMLLLSRPGVGKCGNVGWIGIEVTNELAPFTYIPTYTKKISKNSLIKDLKLTLWCQKLYFCLGVISVY